MHRHPRLAGRRRLHQPGRQPGPPRCGQAGHNVALLDLDLALGDADVALDLMADYTLADVALNIDRLDMTFPASLAQQARIGLSLLPHPVQMKTPPWYARTTLQRVISLMRASYTHLILDLSKSFSPTDVTALRMADVILLVAQLELSSLRNVVRMMLRWATTTDWRRRSRSCSTASARQTRRSPKKAEETIGKPIFWQIPNDPKTMIGARADQGRVPLVSYASKTRSKLPPKYRRPGGGPVRQGPAAAAGRESVGPAAAAMAFSHGNLIETPEERR